jgi:hypothetical protein
LLELTPQRVQVRVGRQRRLAVALGHQAGPAGLQREDLLLQRADTVPAGRLRQPPGLKRPQVAVDGGAPLGQRLVHAGELRAAARVGGLPCLAGACGGLLEDDPVLEGGQDLGEDRVLQWIGRDALLVAALGAVPLAGKAGVVAVGAAVAVGGGADKPIAAAPAAQEPGQ